MAKHAGVMQFARERVLEMHNTRTHENSHFDATLVDAWRQREKMLTCAVLLLRILPRIAGTWTL